MAEDTSNMTEITAKKKINDVDHSSTVYYNFGADLKEATGLFGDDVVHTNFRANAKITAQAAMRRMMEQGKNQDEIAATMANWKPGVALERTVDPVAALIGKMKTMDDKDRKALLKKLEDAAKAA